MPQLLEEICDFVTQSLDTRIDLERLCRLIRRKVFALGRSLSPHLPLRFLAWVGQGVLPLSSGCRVTTATSPSSIHCATRLVFRSRAPGGNLADAGLCTIAGGFICLGPHIK